MRNYIDIEKAIKEMSLKEKAMFLTGSKPMHNYGVKRLNIPSLTLLNPKKQHVFPAEQCLLPVGIKI